MDRQDLKEGQEVYVKGRVIHTGDHLDIVLDKGSFIENAIILHHEKPVVPQFVADWYEENKDDFDYRLWNIIVDMGDEEIEQPEIAKWINVTSGAITTIVNMHQFGYEVEREKRYLVKVVGMNRINGCLSYNKNLDKWFFGAVTEQKPYRTKHTRKELEEAGFGWVFDCKGVEIEEVE